MAKPNLFIVGAPKCGTTSLHHFLARHPECYMSQVKEPGYFSRSRVRPDLRENLPYLRDQASYLELFGAADDSHKVVGESSTSYLRDEAALSEIRECLPGAKIIALVRDPVRLVSSYFNYQRFQGFEPLKTLQAAWEAQDQRCNGQIDAPRADRPDALAYRDVALLGQQIDRLYSFFDRSDVLVLVNTDLRTRPEALCREVQEFLDIDIQPGIGLPRKNVARTPRFQSLDNMIKQSPESLVRWKDRTKRFLGVNRLGIRAMLDRFNSVPTTHSVDESLAQEMRQFFRSDVELLSRLVERPLLQEWGWQ